MVTDATFEKISSTTGQPCVLSACLSVCLSISVTGCMYGRLSVCVYPRRFYTSLIGFNHIRLKEPKGSELPHIGPIIIRMLGWWHLPGMSTSDCKVPLLSDGGRPGCTRLVMASQPSPIWCSQVCLGRPGGLLQPDGGHISVRKA